MNIFKNSKSPIYVSFSILFIFSLYIFIKFNFSNFEIQSNSKLFLPNKFISLTSILLIGISYILGPLSKFWPKIFLKTLKHRKFYGLFGFGLASIHVLFSIILLSPSTYPGFFNLEGSLNFTGQLSLITGLISFFIFTAVSISTIPTLEKELNKKDWLRIQRVGYLAYFFVLLHVLTVVTANQNLIGIPSPKFLTINLLAVCTILMVLVLRLILIFFPGKSS